MVPAVAPPLRNEGGAARRRRGLINPRRCLSASLWAGGAAYLCRSRLPGACYLAERLPTARGVSRGLAADAGCELPERAAARSAGAGARPVAEPAPWGPPARGARGWLGGDVYTSTLGSRELGHEVASFCLELEARDSGKLSSNRGGWQSKDLLGAGDPALSELSSLLHEHLRDFLFQSRGGRAPVGLNGAPTVLSVPQKLWANINRKGDWNELHTHGATTDSMVASGIYYPRTSSAAAAPVRFHPPDGQPFDVLPESGRLLLFPCDLPHEVLPFRRAAGAEPLDAPRMSIAFNLRVRWLDSPLSAAAAGGSEADCRRVLALEGTDVEAADASIGFRAMHLAAEGGHAAIVRLLAEAGAETDVVTAEGWSPLALAADQGHVEVVRYLIESHPEVRFSRPALVDGQWVHTGRAGLQSAIVLAAARGHAAVLDALLGACASLGGACDVTQACAAAVDMGHAELVAKMWAFCAEHDAPLDASSLLHRAARRGQAEAAAALLAAGAHASQRDAHGRLPEQVAREHGHSMVAELLSREVPLSTK